eukprot:scaffold42044_cov57-Attheya_sp.AAC.1
MPPGVHKKLWRPGNSLQHWCGWVRYGSNRLPACLTGSARRSHTGCPTLLCPRRAGRKSSFNDDSTA